MFNFKSVDEPHKLNKNYILSKITDAQIFGYYFGPFKFNESYPSRFRKDKNPSTGFYISSAGNLIYNDLARNNESYDAFAFVQKMYNLSFSDTLKRIAADFGLVTGKPQDMAAKAMVQLKDFDKAFKADTTIHFSAGKWTESNLAFWASYHITKEELKEAGIYVVNDLYISGQEIKKNPEALRFALTETVKGEMRTKIYSPGSLNFKWITNIPANHPFGINQMKRGDSLFIAKAQKDRLVLKKFLPNVIAAQNEKKQALPNDVLTKLKSYYKTIYIGFDNDETGLDSMKRFEAEGLIPVHVPVEWREQAGLKDFADVAKDIGLDGVKHILQQNNVI